MEGSQAAQDTAGLKDVIQNDAGFAVQLVSLMVVGSKSQGLWRSSRVGLPDAPAVSLVPRAISVGWGWFGAGDAVNTLSSYLESSGSQAGSISLRRWERAWLKCFFPSPKQNPCRTHQPRVESGSDARFEPTLPLKCGGSGGGGTCCAAELKTCERDFLGGDVGGRESGAGYASASSTHAGG